MPIGTIEVNWRLSEEELTGLSAYAAHFTLVMFEPRGQGLSDREVDDLSLEARVADMKAVFDGLGIESAGVLARGFTGPTAIAFAARHPEYVSRLVLWGARARGRERGDLSPENRVLTDLIDVNWPLYWQVQALMNFGFTERARFVAEADARASNPDLFKRVWTAMRSYDASEDLPNIRCPTLVIYPEGIAPRAPRGAMSIDVQRDLAMAIPGALLRKSNIGSFTGWGNSGDDHAALLAFLKGDAVESTLVVPSGGTVIILFADIVDSTALTERMGDAAFRERARALDASLRAIISAAGGTAIDGKLLGDGVLATFPAAAQAIDAALRCGTAGDDGGLPLHLGIHAGDVIREQNNVFGGAVNIASRISGLSAPGEVLVSDVVRALARTSASVTFEDRGEHALKGVGEPQRVYAVRREGDA
jgi:class 3 adenylate cyclase/pimeloyl-ACP methyl ester carboxylesterase